MVRLRHTSGDERRTAHALLASTAASCAGVHVSAVTLERTEAGAPRLGGGAAGLHASLSHTGGLVAVAVSRIGPVGVDVEPVRPMPALALSRRWFAPEDTEWLLGRPAETVSRDFLSLWTGKEAVAKQYGTGLRGGRLLRQRIATPRTGAGAPYWQPAVDDPDVVVAHWEPHGFLLALAAGRAERDAGLRLDIATARASSGAQGDPEPGPIASQSGEIPVAESRSGGQTMTGASDVESAGSR